MFGKKNAYPEKFVFSMYDDPLCPLTIKGSTDAIKVLSTLWSRSLDGKKVVCAGRYADEYQSRAELEEFKGILLSAALFTRE